MAVQNRVAELRRTRGESLQRVGRATGIDPAQLHRVERGTGGCSYEKKVRLAEHFGVLVTELFVVAPKIDN